LHKAGNWHVHTTLKHYWIMHCAMMRRWKGTAPRAKRLPCSTWRNATRTWPTTS